MPRPKGARDADYEAKRAALLDRMSTRLMRRESARPSLRQLADAAGVSVPTLRHYFGGRTEVVSAIFESYQARGQSRLAAAAEPHGDLMQSVRQFATSLIEAVGRPRSFRLGDLFAVSLAEGLMDDAIGPSALRYIVDPAANALQARLEAHIHRGQMRPTDARAAALLLLSPLLIATLHQDQLGGRDANPIDLALLVDEICEAFCRAYATGD